MQPHVRPRLANLIRQFPVVELECSTKEAAIAALLQVLVLNRVITEDQAFDIHRAVLRRELLGSTASWGCAEPHTKHCDISSPIVILGRSRNGILWEALDGEPVKIIFLRLGPPTHPGDMLRLGEEIGRARRDDDLRNGILSSDLNSIPQLFERQTDD
jgi:mannitol/fructose-specific phosphotransferase system IIA component (Ntr-type)